MRRVEELEQQKIKDALLESETRLKAFMENVPSLVLIKDHQPPGAGDDQEVSGSVLCPAAISPGPQHHAQKNGGDCPHRPLYGFLSRHCSMVESWEATP